MTMEELARELGVSKSTVSRALSGKGRIGKETVDRIRSAALARGVITTTASARTLGVAIPADSYTTSIPYFHECLLGISAGAAALGYNVMITIDDSARIDGVRELVENDRVAGMILMRSIKGSRTLQYLTDARFPTGLTGCCPYSGVIQVDADNRRAAADMTSMLIEQGYSRFAIITGDKDYQVNIDRMGGFQDALASRGLPLDRQSIYTGFRTVEHIDSIIAQCLISKIECVICGDDVISTWMMSRLQAERLRIPQDIAVASLFNSANLDCFSPPVTTVSISARRMGNMAAQQLIHYIEHGSCTAQTRCDYEILFRKSTQRLQTLAGGVRQ